MKLFPDQCHCGFLETGEHEWVLRFGLGYSAL